jgi:hypothetical protein
MYKISIYVKIKFTFKHILTIKVPNFHGDIPFYLGLNEIQKMINYIS